MIGNSKYALLVAAALVNYYLHEQVELLIMIDYVTNNSKNFYYIISNYVVRDFVIYN